MAWRPRWAVGHRSRSGHTSQRGRAALHSSRPRRIIFTWEQRHEARDAADRPARLDGWQPRARRPVGSRHQWRSSPAHGWSRRAIDDVEWLARFLAAGGASSIDALVVHAYMGSFDATADPSCQPLRFGQVNEFRAVMQRLGAPQSIYITEFGALEDTAIDLGQFNWPKLAPDQRASHLVAPCERRVSSIRGSRARPCSISTSHESAISRRPASSTGSVC
jgi:hypothetical protein